MGCVGGRCIVQSTFRDGHGAPRPLARSGGVVVVGQGSGKFGTGYAHIARRAAGGFFSHIPYAIMRTLQLFVLPFRLTLACRGVCGEDEACTAALFALVSWALPPQAAATAAAAPALAANWRGRSGARAPLHSLSKRNRALLSTPAAWHAPRQLLLVPWVGSTGVHITRCDALHRLLPLVGHLPVRA